MTTFTAAGNAAVLVDSTQLRAVDRPEAAKGWDPYEVWRTRVLAPTLELSTDNRAETPVMPRLVLSV
jgi:hypothetical protein